MTHPVSSQSPIISACHRVLLESRDLQKTIFTYLLEEQRGATRNIKEMKIEKNNHSWSSIVDNCDVFKGSREKEEKVAQAAKALKEGTRNMEVVRSVCKKWNNIILGNKEFHFFLLFTRAKRAMAEETRYRLGESPVDALYEILRVEALGDPTGATSTCRSLPSDSFPDERLLGLIRDAVSKNNLVGAIVMANALKKPKEKILALCEIAKIEPQFIQEAKDLVSQMIDQRSMYTEIAKVEALHNNFAAAIISAKESGREDEKAFVKIAKAAAKHNPGEVKIWASQIKNPEIQALVQFEIALIERAPISASTWLNQFEMVPVKFERSKYSKIEKLAEAFVKLAKLDKSLGYAKAKEHISSLHNGRKKVQLLIEIAELDEKPDFTEAKQVAALAPYPFRDYRNDEDEYYKDYHLGGDHQFREIALAEAKHNAEAAKITADKIVNSKEKEITKCDIEIVRGDINAAKVAAILIDDLLEKSLAFIKIARKDPLHDLTEAKASRYRISSVFKRVSISCKIAEIVLDFPLDHYELRKDRLFALFEQSGRPLSAYFL
jgi:hypothetical protein